MIVLPETRWTYGVRLEGDATGRYLVAGCRTDRRSWQVVWCITVWPVVLWPPVDLRSTLPGAMVHYRALRAWRGT